MGFFNVIKIEAHCPKCTKKTFLNIQFKYGEDWMHCYGKGDAIIWGEKNIGHKTTETVLVSGISEECTICNECSDYIVEIRNNIVYDVYVDKIQLSSEQEGYCIVKTKT